MSKSKIVGPKKGETQPVRIDRTSETDFRVEHDDGSIFEGNIDPSKVQFAEDNSKVGRYHIPRGKVKIHNTLSNAERRKMGIQQDSALPDYQD